MEALLPYHPSYDLQVLATHLDPRFKKGAFGIEENAVSAQEFVTCELSSVCKGTVEKYMLQPETS
jgi:hypothetical protein